MILKGSQRGGSKQLGLHLLKTTENEHVNVHEVRGFAADDVLGALHEAYAISRGTKCKQFLFSVSLNPPEKEIVRTEVFEDAIRKIEERTGLTDQPRVVVFHEKEGRRHAHCVWSRINAETMTAVQLSHFKLNLRHVSREIYLEQEWKLPHGLRDFKLRDPRNFTLDEYQQAKRNGYSAWDVKQAIRECWNTSDNRASFSQALEERGLYLAKGDRRAYVAMTYTGDIYSVPRTVGKRTKEVTTKLGQSASLRSTEETKSYIADQIAPKLRGFIEKADQERGRAVAPLERERASMRAQQAQVRQNHEAQAKARTDAEAKERAGRLRKGIRGLWDLVTGERRRIQQQNETEARRASVRDREQRDAMVAGQLRERQLLQQRIVQIRQEHMANIAELHRDLEELRRNGPAAVKSRAPEAHRPRQSTPIRLTEVHRQVASQGRPSEIQERARPVEQRAAERQASSPMAERARDLDIRQQQQPPSHGSETEKLSERFAKLRTFQDRLANFVGGRSPMRDRARDQGPSR